ncbi:DUF45 domain-containing protein [Pseudoalteromonas sp. MMG010]|uniref:M48 family metallopeptidase n=1 Tax=Pseudoalteromonas sp. MMG010 TaxID=2822685 RepID=UPI001B39D5BA|nr:YgjP-like metallopeptidase domain-containing protein [Pseudoalteromonas sp. MMG010]MBQ4833284.1 DUF45 domain-containing protein [Pseudoalteromonas sp. MMG010]
MFEYQLKRSTRRKTLAIKVVNKKVTVYAPRSVCAKLINEWLLLKQSWVIAQLNKQYLAIEKTQYPFKNQCIQIFSQNVLIHFKTDTKSFVNIDNDYSNMTIHTSSRVSAIDQKRQKLLQECLLHTLEQYIDMKLHYFCQLMEMTLPKKVTIKTYKRRWGSCNNHDELTFNLQLIGADKSIIDYVIVHELAHRVHLNHSTEFWALVSHYYPQYKNAERWLKTNGDSLQWVF